MHTFSESGTGVPAFLAKLWRLVEDAETNDLISWSTDGRSFIIQNQAQFAKELLPLNYKHNNMASFIRQLNMYGFHKITSIDNGGLRFDKDEMEFTHPCFQKDHPYLLEHIKRKIATSKQQQLQALQAADDKSTMKLEAVSRVLSEVKNMRGRQDSLDSRFQTMKQENEALWREVAILRQKHHKQQQIVNKLIQFLVTIVQPSRGGLGTMGNGNNKRRFQLMINDAPQQAKLKKSDYSNGATIEELGEALEEVAYANQQELLSKQDKSTKKPIPVVSAQIDRTTPSSNGGGNTTASVVTSASTPASITKGSRVPSRHAPTLSASGGRTIVKSRNGSYIIRKDKVSPSDKTTRNLEIPEVSSPMSIPERSPYHRTATPAMSTGGSSTRSSNGGNGSEAGDGGGGAGDYDESFEEVFTTSPMAGSFRGSSLGTGRGMVKLEKLTTSNADRGRQAQVQQQHVTRSLNHAGRGRNDVAGTPVNLIQLIESTIDEDDLENYEDDAAEEEDHEGDDNDVVGRDGEQQQGYLVDHVDEIDPTIVQLYQDGDHDMMVNTPMVIKEMEKQEQLKRQAQQQQKLRQQRLQMGGKSGASLLKGGVGAGNNKRNAGGVSAPQLQVAATAQREAQKSLLTSASASHPVKGAVSKPSGTVVGSGAQNRFILTRGGKKLALANVKKQTTAPTGERDRQQGDASSPGPSGYANSGGNTLGKSPPVSTGPTFVAEGGSNYLTASDILPGDLFEGSNDQAAGEAVGDDAMAKEANSSPMLNTAGYSFIDGGYYNPNVNINDMKAGRHQQQQGQAQSGQQSKSQQQLTGSGNGTGDDEYDENSLDSSLLLQRATATEADPSSSNNQQQISKFVSSDSDVSRLSTVAEYGQHIDTVQTDLESLKELLRGEGYQLDANALLGQNAGPTATPYGRVYFPSCSFDSDAINKLFNNNDDMLGYDFPMNLPDLMTDDQQLQQQQQQQQQQNLQPMTQGQQQEQQLHSVNSNSSDRSAPSTSPQPGSGQMSPVSPVPSAHTQLMAFKLGGLNDGGSNNGSGGGGVGAGINNGFFGHGIHGGVAGCGNGAVNNNGASAGLLGGIGGNDVMGPDGTLGILSGDYIDLNELLNMDPNGGHDEDTASMVA